MGKIEIAVMASIVEEFGAVLLRVATGLRITSSSYIRFPRIQAMGRQSLLCSAQSPL
jgi:hypothetical protein